MAASLGNPGGRLAKHSERNPGLSATLAVQSAVMKFVREEASFAQLTTINRSGYPTGRTLGVFVNSDWSVDLVQRRTHARLEQMRRNPKVQVAWVGGPATGSTNDHPHVFDFGRLIPRVVFLRGTAEFMDDDWTWMVFSSWTRRHRARGLMKAPIRQEDNVRASLVGVHLHPLDVRAEGFGHEAETFTWLIKESQ